MAKEAERPSPKWDVGRTTSSPWGWRHPQRPPGYRLQPDRPTFFFIDNWVSPMLPTAVVSRPSGRGTEQRVEEDGKSERRSVIERIGPSRRTYPPRKGADFRLVLTVANSRCVRTRGDVRR